MEFRSRPHGPVPVEEPMGPSARRSLLNSPGRGMRRPAGWKSAKDPRMIINQEKTLPLSWSFQKRNIWSEQKRKAVGRSLGTVGEQYDG